jgi:SprT-like protein
MTNNELQQLVQTLSLQYFNRPFTHLASWNARLKTTGGRYKLSTHNLDFNPRIYERYGKLELEKVIKHELCHYHLHLLNMGYKHQDRDFKLLLKQVGGSRYAPALDERKKHQYRCTNCLQTYERVRRIDLKKYACGKCKGKLVQL